jgi:transcriptional regulator with XRE-family HTH domain
MKLGSKIRMLRAPLRCSQLVLARLAGMSRYRISLFECGYQEPTKEEFATVKAVLARMTKGEAKIFKAGNGGKK